MFAKKNRYSFKGGLPKLVYSTPFFVVRYQKNNTDIKCAVIVSRKIDKRATVRNRLRRIFTESLKKAIADKKVEYDLVFYLRKPILDNTDKINNELQKMLKEKVYG